MRACFCQWNREGVACGAVTLLTFRPRCDVCWLQVIIRGTVPDDDVSLVDPSMLRDHYVHLCLNISHIRTTVRYTTSVYGELSQNMLAAMDLESVLEVQRRDHVKEVKR